MAELAFYITGMRTVRIHVVLLRRINCKRCIRIVAQVINRIGGLRTRAKNRTICKTKRGMKLTYSRMSIAHIPSVTRIHSFIVSNLSRQSRKSFSQFYVVNKIKFIY